MSIEKVIMGQKERTSETERGWGIRERVRE